MGVLKEWKDAYLLIHDTLSANGLCRNHAFLLETIVRFHVDAFPIDNVPARTTVTKGDPFVKNQWFLIIEGETMQACLSMQPLPNNRTGRFGVLTLQLMGLFFFIPQDLLFRQTYHCQTHVTGKAILETVLLKGWHKFELEPEGIDVLAGRRHHLQNMLYYLQDTHWIGATTDEGKSIQDYLAKEYRLVWYENKQQLRIKTRGSRTKPGKFRFDLGKIMKNKPDAEKYVRPPKKNKALV